MSTNDHDHNPRAIPRDVPTAPPEWYPRALTLGEDDSLRWGPPAIYYEDGTEIPNPKTCGFCGARNVPPVPAFDGWGYLPKLGSLRGGADACPTCYKAACDAGMFDRSKRR